MSMSRREFVAAATGAAALGLASSTTGLTAAAEEREPVVHQPGKRIVIASANGLAACERAMELLSHNADPVSAVVAGVNIVEADPNDHSVGYGGLPNEDGVVELDAAVMHGPSHKGGAVAGLRHVRHAASVAQLVMQRTDHVMLVGNGADQFAKNHGFPQEDLLTDDARRIWLQWKERHSNDDNWLSPTEDDELSARLREESGRDLTHGTITCMALTATGDLGGCTSTSGRAFKLAGRVSDSCVLGAGIYVDNAVGASGSTGRGEANILNCSAFLVVELMRAGATPEQACRNVLQRVADHTEPRLRDAEGRPNYQLIMYALRKDGTAGGACMRGPGQMALHDGTACQLVDLPGLYPALPSPK